MLVEFLPGSRPIKPKFLIELTLVPHTLSPKSQPIKFTSQVLAGDHGPPNECDEQEAYFLSYAWELEGIIHMFCHRRYRRVFDSLGTFRDW